MKYLFVNWKTYHQYAQKLASAIISDTHRYDAIIAISRGGLSVGHLLSDFLDIPIYTFTIQSYTDLKTQGEIKITEKLGIPVKGKTLLLVDDVSDSGRTFIRGLSYLKKLKPAKVKTVSMFVKPHTKYFSDYYAKKTVKWILFPYEPTEMIRLITKNLKENGRKKPQIQKYLLNLGFNLKQIAFVRKHYL
ncbi:phosphoribosyltransferase [Patescibacteria group bacterium]